MYRTFREISFRFDGKTQWQLFLLLYNRHVSGALLMTRENLNLAEVVYISIIFHIPASWLNLLNGHDFYFWWRITANQPLGIFGFVLWRTLPMALFVKLRWNQQNAKFAITLEFFSQPFLVLNRWVTHQSLLQEDFQKFYVFTYPGNDLHCHENPTRVSQVGKMTC